MKGNNKYCTSDTRVILKTNCRFIFKTLLVISGLFISKGAWAYCNAPNGTVNLSPSPAVIQRDAPIGTVIASGMISTTIPCTSQGGQGEWRVALDSSNTDYGAGTTLSNVRKTPMPGIGIRWSNFNENSGTTDFMSSGPLNDTSKYRGINGARGSAFRDSFELVKIGDIKPGNFDAWPLAYSYRSGANIEQGRLFTLTLNQVPIQQVACTVTKTMINVPLGVVLRSVFSGVGSTAQPVSLSIPLDCDSTARVNMTLDAITEGSRAPGVIALDSSPTGETASGVGVQLLFSDTPVTFGTPIAIATTDTEGALVIPLIARYYQTTPNITAGQANATATFTMTYN